MSDFTFFFHPHVEVSIKRKDIQVSPINIDPSKVTLNQVLYLNRPTEDVRHHCKLSDVRFVLPKEYRSTFLDSRFTTLTWHNILPKYLDLGFHRVTDSYTLDIVIANYLIRRAGKRDKRNSWDEPLLLFSEVHHINLTEWLERYT